MSDADADAARPVAERAWLAAFGVRAAVRRAFARVAALWRRSLALRVVLTTLALSVVVVLVLGWLLLTRVTDGLLAAKQRSALDEARAGLTEAQSRLDAADRTDVASTTVRLDQITRQLANRAGTPALYEVLLLRATAAPVTNTPEFGSNLVGKDSLPTPLREAVAETQTQSYTYSEIRYVDGRTPVPGFVVGAPLSVPGVGPYELYYLFPLTQEQETLALVQRAMLAAGLVLVGLLGSIAWIVTRQVVTPVRLAARTAEQFSAGRLEERMAVVGEDDLAKLATSFNQMAGSLQGQITQLEDLSRVQRRFVSDVSHELRTPLTTVRMAADVLHEARGRFDPATARSAELLQTQLDRFEALLTDLLEISRYDAGAAVLDAEPSDVCEVARRVVEAAEPLAERRGSTVRLVAPGESCVVVCDPRRVERILRNLVVNAIEHGAGQPVDVRVVADPGAVAVGVRDHGVGLRPGEAALVFNRFWRADPARARTTGGTGLGLAIALEDARLHGGWLQAWGQPGDGAHFRLTLPRRAGEELSRSPLPLEPADAAPSRRVPLPAGIRRVDA
ncbi:MAG: MtrAB system histidine kinase MtrB [Actinomycetia bacterium]|nr:MtrAB system histidine kinase MtrB [Actinomycetes bacterium]